uniref:Portal protein n=1 Tax=Gokushovirinae environmental samples TaxID=1478972 RepID=A0A2R3UAI8_9VIRU|nr:portal protein [Gokushovirinae environmental samples]
MSQAYYEKYGVGEIYSARYPGRLEVLANIEGPSMTREEFAEECDINAIMARYEKNGGQWPPLPNGQEPQYVDFVGMPDLQNALHGMIEAENAFMRLPALVRREFDNDPVRFVEYAQNRDNLGKLREWGLAEPEKAPEPPMRVEVVSPPIAPANAPAPAG